MLVVFNFVGKNKAALSSLFTCPSSSFLPLVLHLSLPPSTSPSFNMQSLLRSPMLAETPSGARPLSNTTTRPSAAVVSRPKKPMQFRVVPRAAMKDVASAAADASGLTMKEAEAAVRAAFDFIAAEVRRERRAIEHCFECF